MRRTLIGALAGILTFGGINSNAQNLETKIQYEVHSDSSKTEIQTKNSALDSLVKIYKTPGDIQRFVAQNIEYIKNSERFYPEVNKNSAPDNFIRFPSPEQILNKKYGDCEEGFVLTASALKKLGYETAGIIMMPKNGESGHIFTIYQDTLTKLYGTAGISVEDYISPVYNSIDSLIAGLALKSKYHDFKITGVEVTDDIFNNSNQIDLPKQYVKDMNLTDIFGVMFKTEKISLGTLEKDIYDKGYSISLKNTIIEPKNLEKIKGPITDVNIDYSFSKTVLGITYTNDHRYTESINFHLEKEQLKFFYYYKQDRANGGEMVSMESYDFCPDFSEHPFLKCISQKESQEYIDLANYFLKLMKNDETKELWEQTKKQRELNKSKQDSLQINFPKD
ncbi:MAG: transglutaminase-like domain-containing protein [Nanoarchaeota archaeon]|nr:transglutaminase-like domain-containing protein [Nanoarchaeota archaeon]